MRAFSLAVEQGAEALEFDVRLSSDGVVVVCHDPTLARTTNRPEPVESLTCREICEADAGYHFCTDGGYSWPFRDQGVRIPAVAEVFDTFPDLPLLIEVKTAAAAGPLARMIRERGAESRVVVASFLEEALQALEGTPPIPTGASRPGIFRLWSGSRIGMHPRKSPYALYAVPDRYKGWLPVATPGLVKSSHRMGCPVHVWTVNDPGRARQLWGMGVNGVITNYPGMMVSERRAIGY